MRLHPLTVVLEGGGRALAAGAVGLTVGSVLGTSAVAARLGPGVTVLAGVPVGVLFAALAVAYEVVHYRHFEYELTEDTLDITSGVFFRRDREIPYGRVQNVDVVRDVFARVLGVAVLSLETAGGGETEARLRYVGIDEARRVQSELQRRKGSVGSEPAEVGPASTRLFALDDRDLLLLSVLSFDPRFLSVVLVALPAIGPNLLPSVDTTTRAVVVGLSIVGVLVSGLALWAASAAATFVRYYGFELHRVGDELRYERGLIQRYDGSIPLSKVQTVVVDENVLMRRFGYASLSVETAGYAPGSTPARGSEAAIPLAERDALMDLAREIEPFEQPPLARPPVRAKRRYVIRYALLVAAIVAIGYAVDVLLIAYPWYLLVALFLAVPVAADRKWRHTGWALGRGYAFTRRGFWRRRTHVIPDFRVQTVADRQTVFQRRWSLGSVVIDTASSRSLTGDDATAVDLDASDANQLREAVRTRLGYAIARRRSGAGDN